MVNATQQERLAVGSVHRIVWHPVSGDVRRSGIQVLTVGRRIPAPDAPMVEKLECREWVEYFERKGMLDWARREAGL